MSAARRLALVGAGRCASSIAFALRQRGWEVAALTCLRPASAEAASEMLGGVPIAASNSEAAAAAGIVLIGVPDRAVEAVAEEIAAPGAGLPDLSGHTFLHLAGVLDSGALAALAGRGAATGSFHPLQTFPERIEQPAWLRGIYFAVEGDPRALSVAGEIVAALEGRLLSLAPGKKALYHAAASIASNHLAAVLDFSHGLLVRAGVEDPAEARRALMPLVLTTLGNTETEGAGRALTGPIVRGDDETVVRHLQALDPEGRERYAHLADLTLDLARRSGRLDQKAAVRIEDRLHPRPLVELVLSLRSTTVAGLAERAADNEGEHRTEYRLDWLEEAIPADSAWMDGASILAVRPGTQATAEVARAFLAHHGDDDGHLVDLPLGLEAGFPPERMILSWHGKAESALAAAREIARRHPAVAKAVIEAREPADLLVVPEVSKVLRRGSVTVVAFASGELGLPTRLLPAHFGSDWTYACRSEDERTAEGQVSLRLLRDRHKRVDPFSRPWWNPLPLWGLAGWPIRTFPFPRDFFNQLLPGVYAPFPTRELAPTLALLRELDFRGLSVTMPLKEEAFRLVDRRSPDAEATASVNTIVREGERLIGHNTDAAAVAETAAALLSLAGARALVLGAGGSARSAAVGLRDRGARVTLVSRHPDKARAAAERLGVAFAERTEAVAWDLLVNATPAGMGSDAGSIPLAPEILTGRAVVDLVYDPRETRLIQEARARGLATAPGLEVFLRQAARQVALFRGKPITVAELRALLEP